MHKHGPDHNHDDLQPPPPSKTILERIRYGWDIFRGNTLKDGPSTAEQSKLGKDFLKRWYHLTKAFYTHPESRWSAWGYTVMVVIFLVTITNLNGQLNQSVRGMYNAMNTKDQLILEAALWTAAGWFSIALPVRIFQDFFNETFALSWRRWMTRTTIYRWLSNWSFVHLNENKRIDNPDERIQVDADHVTGGTLMFISAVAMAVSNMIYFIPMLWGYSPYLVMAGAGYALFGTLVTRWLGLKLVGLQFVQRYVEGNFRTALVNVKENTISIALYQGEKQEIKRLEGKFGDVVRNTRSMIVRNVILTGVTKCYDYANSLLPFMIIGPLVTASLLDAGAVPSASQAFGLVMGSLSILITQFKTLADLAADVNRLADFNAELDKLEAAQKSPHVTEVDEPRIVCEGVTVAIPENGRVLIQDLTLTIEKGDRVLVVGRRGCGKSSTFKSIFGLWPSPTGTVQRPPLEKLSFVPQATYIFEGSLRDNLLYPGVKRPVCDEELIALLHELKLTDIIEKDGVIDPTKLDEVRKWKDILSGGQQQSVGFARMFLRDTDIVVLDESTSSLDVVSQAHMYNLLKAKGKTVLSIGHSLTLIDHHDRIVWVDGETKSVRIMRASEYKDALAESEAFAFELKGKDEGKSE